MSVVIDMEMPRSCYDCKFLFVQYFNDDNFCAVLERDLRNDQLMSASTCPLEEIKDDKD